VPTMPTQVAAWARRCAGRGGARRPSKRTESKGRGFQALLRRWQDEAKRTSRRRDSWARCTAVGGSFQFTVAATALVIGFACTCAGRCKVSDGGASRGSGVAPGACSGLPPEAYADAKARAQPSDARKIRRAQRAGYNRRAHADDLREATEKTKSSCRRSPTCGGVSGKGDVGNRAAGSRGTPPAQRATPRGSRRRRLVRPIQRDAGLSPAAARAGLVVRKTRPETRSCRRSVDAIRLLRSGWVAAVGGRRRDLAREATGVTETLTAGASPSPSVCWLIGPASRTAVDRRPFLAPHDGPGVGRFSCGDRPIHENATVTRPTADRLYHRWGPDLVAQPAV